MVEFIIKKGKPPPKRGGNAGSIYPFHQLEIGTFFEFHYGDEAPEKARRRIGNSAYAYSSTHPDFIYTTRHNKLNKTIECYRITKEEKIESLKKAR